MRRASLVAVAIVSAGLRMAPDAEAQNRNAVFIHGFGAEASDWAATADRLKASVAITPHLPAIKWREKYETQAKTLHSQPAYQGLPTNAVAIGHSNGGIVAREWSKLHRLGGIVTLGTPHLGAPIMGNLVRWAAFTGTTRGMVTDVVRAFGFTTEWTWVIGVVENALNVTADFSIWSLTNLITVLGGKAAMPVAPQMLPGSAYLSALNGSSNLARESSDVPHRVGIASIARNFFYAGPARAIVPDQADRIATTMYAAASTLLFWGNHILVSAPPTDTKAVRQALALIDLANQILAIDPTYCLMVSTPNLSDCVPNDGIVPITSQAYPGAPNILIEGPAHRQEKQESSDALYAALVNYLHVPKRTSPPPPAPPPNPPPPPPGPGPEPEPEAEPDPIFAPAPGPELPPVPFPAPPPAPVPEEPKPPVPVSPKPPDPEPEDAENEEEPEPASGGELDSGDELRPGDVVRSTNGRVRLVYQGDGNLVLYHDDGGWNAVWASDTAGASAGFAAMQGDGNLVVYDNQGRAVWASDTFRSRSWLAVQNDGNLVIYDPNGSPVWATDTFLD
jgi:pimeloyl-ACP methyl ester carboxylesterase